MRRCWLNDSELDDSGWADALYATFHSMNHSATYTFRKDLLISKADVNSQTSQRSSLYVYPVLDEASASGSLGRRNGLLLKTGLFGLGRW